MATVTDPAGPARPEPRLVYQPAIDGLRAIAVTAVVLYHLGLDWMVGGYLGVEVFFVISGFLITSLMLAEHLRTGTIDLRQFWIRRARRLLPALYLFLVGVVAYMAIGPSDELIDVRGDVLAALTYVTNWFLVLADVSYFEALGRPSPFQHLWSLALEEQFYLLWPIMFAGGLWITRGRQRPLTQAMLLGVVASTVAMFVMYDPAQDPSRVYYGTDTRAAGLLLGSALAMIWSPWRLRNRVGDRAPQVLDTMAAAGVVGLVLLFWRLDELSPSLYRGGFLLTAVLTCVVIASLVHPAARLAPRILAAPPLVWLGVRSYSLYLWHWPIIVFTRPRIDSTLDGWTLHGLRIALALVLAELSYTYVETPIRNGAIGRWWARLPGDEFLRRRSVVFGAAALLPIALLTVALLRATPAENEVASTSDVADLIAGSTTVAPATTVPDATTPGDEASPATTPTSAAPESTTSTTVEVTTTVPTTEARLPRTLAVAGDSVALTMAINLPSDLTSLNVVDASIEGCGVIESGDVLTEGRVWRNYAACSDVATRWANVAAGNELTLVTLGAWEVFDVRIDDVLYELGTPNHDALVTTGLRDGVDALLATGTEVVLLEVPCFDPIDGGGLIAKPERGDRTRTDHITSLIRQVADDYDDGVTVMSPPSEFCDDPAISGDANLRWDGVHYGPLGGAFIWGRLEPELLAVPVDY